MEKVKRDNQCLRQYESPETTVVEMRTDSIICMSDPEDLTSGFWL